MSGLTKLAALLAVGLALCGCATTEPPSLPGLGGFSEKVLTPEEQEAKIKQLAKARAEAEATVQQAVDVTSAQ